MPKLSKLELTQHRAWLSEWRTPGEVAAYVTAVNDAMGSADFFRQGGVEFLRDAWLAAEFGRHRQSTSVRLVAERDLWPDFEARDGGGEIERVECGEADIPARRRGDEYRVAAERSENGKRNFEHDPMEDWIMRADQVPTALATVIASKRTSVGAFCQNGLNRAAASEHSDWRRRAARRTAAGWSEPAPPRRFAPTD